ncbi:MAG: hypothetical protein RLY43_1414 [Bacteroidota bacterium]
MYRNLIFLKDLVNKKLQKMTDIELKLKKLQARYESAKDWASVLSEVNYQLKLMDVGYIHLNMPKDRGFTKAEMEKYQDHIDQFFETFT